MTFFGREEEGGRREVSATAHVFIDCTNGPQELGPIDFERYCQEAHDGRHAYIRPDRQWGCDRYVRTGPGCPGGTICLDAFDPGAFALNPGHMDDACRRQYRDDAYAWQPVGGGPDSWRCYVGYIG